MSWCHSTPDEQSCISSVSEEVKLYFQRFFQDIGKLFGEFEMILATSWCFRHRIFDTQTEEIRTKFHRLRSEQHCHAFIEMKRVSPSPRRWWDHCVSLASCWQSFSRCWPYLSPCRDSHCCASVISFWEMSYLLHQLFQILKSTADRLLLRIDLLLKMTLDTRYARSMSTFAALQQIREISSFALDGFSNKPPEYASRVSSIVTSNVSSPVLLELIARTNTRPSSVCWVSPLLEDLTSLQPPSRNSIWISSWRLLAKGPGRFAPGGRDTVETRRALSRRECISHGRGQWFLLRSEWGIFLLEANDQSQRYFDLEVIERGDGRSNIDSLHELNYPSRGFDD